MRPGTYGKDAVAMKLYVWKAPGFLSPLLKKLFAGQGRKRAAEQQPKTYLKQ